MYVPKEGSIYLSTNKVHPHRSWSGSVNLMAREIVLFVVFVVRIIAIVGVMNVVIYGALATKWLVEFIVKVTPDKYNNFTTYFLGFYKI